jgi:hypothetical protein
MATVTGFPVHLLEPVNNAVFTEWSHFVPDQKVGMKRFINFDITSLPALYNAPPQHHNYTHEMLHWDDFNFQAAGLQPPAAPPQPMAAVTGFPLVEIAPFLSPALREKAGLAAAPKGPLPKAVAPAAAPAAAGGFGAAPAAGGFGAAAPAPGGPGGRGAGGFGAAPAAGGFGAAPAAGGFGAAPAAGGFGAAPAAGGFGAAPAAGGFGAPAAGGFGRGF